MSETFGNCVKVTYLSDERVEELRAEVARLKNDVDQLTKSGAVLEQMLDKCREECLFLRVDRDRVRRGDWTTQELAELGKVVKGCDAWLSFLSDKSVEYSVGEDGVERYGFETVTVFRREGREASVRCFAPIAFRAIDSRAVKEFSDREAAEAWCVEQLRPKWRAAKEDGSDNGKACRFRDSSEEWLDGKLLMHEPAADGPWVVLFDGVVNGWDFCEVRD